MAKSNSWLHSWYQSCPPPLELYSCAVYSALNSTVRRSDAFTKFERGIYTAALERRLPDMPLAPEPECKAPNLINSAAFAAQWKDKDMEDFDD